MTARIALVTGGSRGIGAAICRTLARDGFDIALTYSSNEEKARETKDAVEALGRRALVIRADGAKAEENRHAVEATVAAFGTIDALVCNAGCYPYGTIETMTDEDIDRTLALNLRAVMVETAAAVPHMRRGGRLIYMGSAFGERVPLPGVSVYAATKAALIGFVRGLARDLGPQGITANVVQPGPIDTDLNPKDGDSAALIGSFVATGHYGETADIAEAVSYLASARAGYVTGSTLTVDGGLCA
ncbi:SDR family oxidoreductase [Swaminathania salitolerans]|uniref:3-ketoacyl-ACP reductase n=1 Tax=Swaminathania salitolerans TaxID=182838 RepID=A0A511BNU6_9PROT|nr:SDR family oxidoreductase [Swaminathania salitolerans]GBQ15155.1 oxidoreductase [Swaminathania salitolerans LMG 21291]GEL02009.1 3-ketoacyl-ACP reductase [Swaminathania salitolerans]